MKIVRLAAMSAAIAAASPALAAINLTVEGGGTPIVYEGANGNKFAVFGIDRRPLDADGVVNQPAFTLTEQYIRDRFATQANRVVNIFYNPNNSSPAFDPANSFSAFAPIDVADEARLYNSLLIEFTGTGNVTAFRGIGTGSSTVNLTPNQAGAPPIGAPVPEPATWAMMMLGFGGLGYTLRRRPTVGARIRFA
jgi:hypothetical protein